jgi:hypothetical protein
MKAVLSPWPVSQPANWTARVNVPLTAKELDRVRASIERGRPYGDDEWVRQTVKALSLEDTVRRESRPRKANRSVTGSAGQCARNPGGKVRWVRPPDSSAGAVTRCVRVSVPPGGLAKSPWLSLIQSVVNYPQLLGNLSR